MKSALSFLAGLLLMSASVEASAEYYMVYPVGDVVYEETGNGCFGCGINNYCDDWGCGPCPSCRHREAAYVSKYEVPVVNIYSSAPRRHAAASSGEVATYAWIPTPEAP